MELIRRLYFSSNSNERAIALIGALHELIKYKHYIGMKG